MFGLVSIVLIRLEECGIQRNAGPDVVAIRIRFSLVGLRRSPDGSRKEV